MNEPALNPQRLRMLTDDWARQCGERIRSRRIGFKWSQEQLASAVGVRPQSISKFELGTATPKEAVRLALANALMCEASELFPPIPRALVVMSAGKNAA
jgi:transcriptional regulator with XRE-family HTH domain